MFRVIECRVIRRHRILRVLRVDGPFRPKVNTFIHTLLVVTLFFVQKLNFGNRRDI